MKRGVQPLSRNAARRLLIAYGKRMVHGQTASTFTKKSAGGQRTGTVCAQNTLICVGA